jgi:hypothetical protein
VVGTDASVISATGRRQLADIHKAWAACWRLGHEIDRVAEMKVRTRRFTGSSGAVAAVSPQHD